MLVVVMMMMMMTMMRRMMVMVMMMMIACDFNDGYDDNDQRFHDDGDGCHRGDDCFHDGDGGVGDDDDDGVKMMLVMLIMVNWWPRRHVHLLIYIYISLYAEQTVRPIQLVPFSKSFGSWHIVVPTNFAFSLWWKCSSSSLLVEVPKCWVG